MNGAPKIAKLTLGSISWIKVVKLSWQKKSAIEIEGICRGTTVLKNKEKVNYKISFSTRPENANLVYTAITKDSLWNTDKNLNPEINFFQPTWNQHRNQKILIINKNRSITVTRGHETVVQLKSDDIDVVFIEGEMGISNKTYAASIVVKNYDGESVLENSTCDLML